MPVRKLRFEYAVAETVEDQGRNLTLALNLGLNAFTHMLFCYLLREYRSRPTKTKAIFIWNRCLKHLAGWSGIGTSDLGLIEMDLGVDECEGGAEGRNIITTLKATIALIEHSRELAVKTNRISRFLTSASRVPNNTIFDAFETAMLKRIGDSPWLDIENWAHFGQDRTGDARPKYLRLFPKLRADLKAAGFIKVELAVATVR
ncbi:hypothetical protein FAZ69_15710 [Trinickia terrae]|uniref:Uncharacterized protein n=1 Tax=Trinickia terrae TaxID=2571161 RepID=A0A4U1I3B8_9BURK|nr:hypothetical protein [Trinickia terrae]TKC87733.1 hypothetical protein FAZ69_15710 [Trinickia terrae]